MNSQVTAKTPRWQEQVTRLQRVTEEVDGYFGRLGGSGRYMGFDEWHVPALILLLISGVDPTSKDFLQSKESYLVSPSLWRETDSLVEKTRRGLTDFTMSPAVFHVYLNNVTRSLCDSNSEPEQLLGWMRFITENSDRFRSFTR